MLIEELRPRTRKTIDHGAIVEHVICQQPVAGTQGMQQDDVVRTLTNGIVQLDIEFGFPPEIVGAHKPLPSPS